MLNWKWYQASNMEIEFNIINMMYAALPMLAQTEKTTFLCKDDCILTKHSRCWTYSALRYFHYPIYRVYGYKWKMCTGSWDIDLNLRINLKCNQNWGTFWLVFLHIVKVIVALNLIFYKTDIVENFTPNLIYNFFQSYHQSSLSLCFIHCTFHIYDIQPQHRGGLAQ